MSNYPELPWIAEARKHIGLKENTSKFKHSPTILSWADQDQRQRDYEVCFQCSD